ncbi:hypothetical protein, partial [Coprobacillus cateniformis]|uniref:hypothetical protein n=1 Tax=Coprobacillus cateniformis TaxID=100884 RepID=UPI0039A22E1C
IKKKINKEFVTQGSENMKNRLTYIILLTIIMAMLTGIAIGLSIGINLKGQMINTGDTYKYYEKQEDEQPNVWDI